MSPDLTLRLPPTLAEQVGRVNVQLVPMLVEGPAGGKTWLFALAPPLVASITTPFVGQLVGLFALGLVLVAGLHLALWYRRRIGAARDRRTPVIRGAGRLVDRCNAALPRALALDAQVQAGLSTDQALVDDFYAVRRGIDGLVHSLDRQLRQQRDAGEAGTSSWLGKGGELSDLRHDLKRLAERFVAIEARLPPLADGAAVTGS